MPACLCLSSMPMRVKFYAQKKIQSNQIKTNVNLRSPISITNVLFLFLSLRRKFDDFVWIKNCFN